MPRERATPLSSRRRLSSLMPSSRTNRLTPISAASISCRLLQPAMVPSVISSTIISSNDGDTACTVAFMMLLSLTCLYRCWYKTFCHQAKPWRSATTVYYYNLKKLICQYCPESVDCCSLKVYTCPRHYQRQWRCDQKEHLISYRGCNKQL